MKLAQTVLLGLLTGGVYALLASGLTLVFGVMRIINVAQGALLILAALFTFEIWRFMGLIWRNVFRSVTPSYFASSFHVGGLFLPKGLAAGCVTAVVVLGLLYLALTRTWTGRAIRAAAENVQGAQLVGVSVVDVAAVTFAIGIATTGAGGSILSILQPFFPASHYVWISKLLGIIVLGGMGSLPGAVIGALLLGVAENVTSAYVSPRWSLVVFYVVIMVVLLVRPQGIAGSRLREDVAA